MGSVDDCPSECRLQTSEKRQLSEIFFGNPKEKLFFKVRHLHQPNILACYLL